VPRIGNLKTEYSIQRYKVTFYEVDSADQQTVTDLSSALAVHISNFRYYE